MTEDKGVLVQASAIRGALVVDLISRFLEQLNGVLQLVGKIVDEDLEKLILC